CMQGLDFPPTF
nr:immunoglobulin light chain junction region [Macaca mulatta]MOX84964.1 immunoglobulin light chain junction region [Macaca mulatta]MOX88236.1 immunoglobulin light chain junction region [Macaca mulatta]MOX90421.1 immunoglobulin light chain junction region [Macaca mulatta]MOX90902.1 immunoglobulin light chain junction region [Macaca mulatta]